MSRVYFDYSVNRFRAVWAGQLAPIWFGTRAAAWEYVRQCDWHGIMITY